MGATAGHPVSRAALTWGMTFLLSAATFAATSDLRVADAVKNRDKASVRDLLKQRVDVNAPQPDGATALHWAAYWDDLETADLLIHAGARPNVANEFGVTPLALASTNGNVAMVEKLIKAGANPNAALPTGETALMAAARSGSVGVVNLLLAQGADPNAKETTQGQTALMWAASERHIEVAKILLEHGANLHARSTTREGFTPLLFSVREGDLDTVKLFLSAGGDVNETGSDGSSLLLVATVRGQTELAHFLLDRGANPNADGVGFAPLHWAVGKWETNLSSAKFGIKAPLSPEWKAISGLQGPEKIALIKDLLAHGANPNARAKKNPPRFGTPEAGGGPNMAGGTPFVMAAAAGDIDVMRLLLASGAESHTATSQNVTPLMAAVGMFRNMDSGVTESMALDAAKFLVDLGADVNAANTADGGTALFAVAQRGFDTIAQFLLDKGANVNAKDKVGWTALTIAEGVYSNGGIRLNRSTAELLRKSGATANGLDYLTDPLTGNATPRR